MVDAPLGMRTYLLFVTRARTSLSSQGLSIPKHHHPGHLNSRAMRAYQTLVSEPSLGQSHRCRCCQRRDSSAVPACPSTTFLRTLRLSIHAQPHQQVDPTTSGGQLLTMTGGLDGGRTLFAKATGCCPVAWRYRHCCVCAGLASLSRSLSPKAYTSFISARSRGCQGTTAERTARANCRKVFAPHDVICTHFWSRVVLRVQL